MVTLPKKSSPTGTDAVTPVALTYSLVYNSLSMFQRLEILTRSVSRYKTIPLHPLLNSTISPDFKDVSP